MRSRLELSAPASDLAVAEAPRRVVGDEAAGLQEGVADGGALKCLRDRAHSGWIGSSERGAVELESPPGDRMAPSARRESPPDDRMGSPDHRYWLILT